ncbi:MAG: hypothetical protein ACRC0F_06650, partial [Cetobacterium sp.]
YREIKEGGIAIFLVVAFMSFMGYATYRSEQRADMYSRVMAEERIETNKILADLSATMKAIQHRLGILEYKVESKVGGGVKYESSYNSGSQQK